jgi:hypothetical protein
MGHMMKDTTDPIPPDMLVGINKDDEADATGIRFPFHELVNLTGHGTLFPENASIHSCSLALHFQTSFPEYMQLTMYNHEYTTIAACV